MSKSLGLTLAFTGVHNQIGDAEVLITHPKEPLALPSGESNNDEPENSLDLAQHASEWSATD